MLSEELFKKEITKITQYDIDFENFMMYSDLVYSEEAQRDDNMITDYYYLYYNYDLNCMIHFKETTIGDITALDEVVNEKTIGYDILKCYKFR